MPLAIELAAARMRTMAVAQLAERLDDRFRLLTGGSRTAVPRHQTLRAAIDWSWELLPDAEQGLLRRLAVFTGGATLEAVRSGCAPTPSSQQIRCPTWSPRWSTSRCWWSPATRYRATGCSRPSGRTAWTGSTRRRTRRPPSRARQVLRRARRDRRAVPAPRRAAGLAAPAQSRPRQPQRRASWGDRGRRRADRRASSQRPVGIGGSAATRRRPTSWRPRHWPCRGGR